MNQGKVLTLVAIFCTVVACSQDNKKPPNSALYQLSDTVDYERAARLNLELGVGYLKQEQIARAKSKFLRAKKLAPQLPEVHYSYAYFLEYVGDLQDAKKAYLKAISLDPKSGNSHHNYGTFLCRTHQYREAEKEFLKAVSDPNYTKNAESFENAGLCILKEKDVAKATEYFEKALRNDPNRPTTLLELAIIKFQQKNIPEAKEYHKRFAKLSNPTERSLSLESELAKDASLKLSSA